MIQPPINSSIAISTPALKQNPFLLQQQHAGILPPPSNNQQPGFLANMRNNKLAQKFLMNSVTNYYESIAVNSAANQSNSNSPVVKYVFVIENKKYIKGILIKILKFFRSRVISKSNNNLNCNSSSNIGQMNGNQNQNNINGFENGGLAAVISVSFSFYFYIFT